LKHEAFFRAVTVDPGGYGVSWDDETDLSEYELWNNGVEDVEREIDTLSNQSRPTPSLQGRYS
jgi:hypothetical protein